VNEALNEGAKHLRSAPKELDPELAEIAEEALDNFRPNWRQVGKL
jgi:hypothetical protein